MTGVTGLLAIGWVAAAGYTWAHHDNLATTCGMTMAGCSDADRSSLYASAVTADVFLGLTLAAAATTVVMFILEPRLHRRAAAADRAQLRLTPQGVTF
jgi:hypothetical protein